MRSDTTTNGSSIIRQKGLLRASELDAIMRPDRPDAPHGRRPAGEVGEASTASAGMDRKMKVSSPLQPRCRRPCSASHRAAIP